MKGWSLARRFFAGQLLFVLFLTAGISWAMYLDAQAQVYQESAERMLAVAATLADDPYVLSSVRQPDPSALLQPYAQKVMTDTGADFVTIMAPDRTRFTHPDRAEIGKKYIGTIAPALAGETFTETYAGTLGPSVRTIAPIKDDAGTVVALVSAGVTVSNVSAALNERLPIVFLTAAGALAIGAVVSYLLSRYLNRTTLGRGPEELSRMFVFYDSVLHSVREGVVLVNPAGELVLYNDEAARLLDLSPVRAEEPARVEDLGLSASLRELLASGRRARDEFHFTDERVLVVNQEPAIPGRDGSVRGGPDSRAGAAAADGKGAGPGGSSQSARNGRADGNGSADSRGRSVGTVTTLRDHTEIEELTGELQSMRTLTDALRAQTHEHSNRLHTIVSLIELGRGADALDFATRDLEQSQRLADEAVAAVDEPFLTALLVGKAAQASERGIDLRITAQGRLESAVADPGELVTIVGNLLDNAFDAAAGSPDPAVTVAFTTTDRQLEIEVRDSGCGLQPGERERIFELGFSTKPAGEHGRGIGLALVRQSVNRLGGELTVDGGSGVPEAGTGAVFTVRLPLRAGSGPASSETQR